MNRIEQVKKILYQGYLTDIAAEKINALYSEPQVCPKPEKMYICPKGEECKHCNDNPIYGHNKPHLHRTECDHISPKCPACIPVPSTPASGSDRIYPCNKCGKLRSKDEGGTTFSICDECWEKQYGEKKGETPASDDALEALIIFAMTMNGEYKIENVAEHAEQIAKALRHAGYSISTPASEHIGDVTEMIAQHGTNVAPSTPSSVPLPPDELLRKLKEDVAAEIQYLFQGKRPPTWSDGVKQMRLEQADVILLKCHQSEAAIRADQNKKIATWIQKNDNHFIFHFIPECGGDFCFLATEGMENECAEPDEGAGYCQYRDKCRYANKQLLFGQNFIAKLQKGDF